LRLEKEKFLLLIAEQLELQFVLQFEISSSLEEISDIFIKNLKNNL
jgi:hypothetical protein